MHDVLDLFRQSEVLRRRPHGVDKLEKCRQTDARLASNRVSRRNLPQALDLRLRALLQRFQRSRADPARREVDHAQECAVIVRRGDEPQIGKRVLDLSPLEKAHAAIHAIGHAGVEECVLEHARLGVGSIQHGHLRGRNPVVDEAFHDVDDERRLVSVRWRDERAHRLALRVGGPQILAQPTLVMPDQRIRRVENVTVRAVVLLELDQLYRRFGRGEVALEVLHVGDARTAKRIDRLVVIADREHCGVWTGQQPDPAVL